MRHITPARLADLDSLLTRLREIDALVERKPGNFSVRSRAYLHFHEDGDDLYADVRLDLGGDFERLRVTTTGEQAALVAKVRKSALGR